MSESKLLHEVSGRSTRDMVLGSAILVQRGHQRLPNRTRRDALLSESLPPIVKGGGRVTSRQSNAMNDSGLPALCPEPSSGDATWEMEVHGPVRFGAEPG